MSLLKHPMFIYLPNNNECNDSNNDETIITTTTTSTIMKGIVSILIIIRLIEKDPIIYFIMVKNFHLLGGYPLNPQALLLDPTHWDYLCPPPPPRIPDMSLELPFIFF